MWRGERKKQVREKGRAKGIDGKRRREQYDRKRHGVKWSGEKKK